MPGPTGLEPGIHRAPGVAALCDVLAERAASVVLDLGPSSTENVAFLAGLGAQVQIQDLFRSSGGAHGSRAEIFRFRDPASLSLPTEGRFDAILAWDLLHYLEPADIPPLAHRLADLCRAGALLLAMASAAAPIPPTPMQFKIVRRDRLEYRIQNPARLAVQALSPRRVEKLLPGFRPLRLFQLRNGFQELLFCRCDPAPVDAAAPAEGPAVRGDDASR